MYNKTSMASFSNIRNNFFSLSKFKNNIALYLIDKKGTRGSLYLLLSPVSHYLKKFRVLRNVMFLTSERFLTVIGIMLGLLGLLLSTFNLSAQQMFFYLICSIFFMPFLAVYITLSLTRTNPQQFASLISSSDISLDQFIRYTSYEAHRVVNFLTKYKGEDIYWALQSINSSIKIVDEAKKILADRLGITQRELSDDFLNYSSGILINRAVKLIDLSNDDLNNKEGDREAVEKYFDEVRFHLLNIVRTNVDLNRFGFIFQTKSVSGATQQLIKFFQDDIGKVKSIRELRTLVEMQKALKTGCSANRAIGLAISGYSESKKTPEDIKICKSRVFALSEKVLEERTAESDKQISILLNEIRDGFTSWQFESNRTILKQRSEVIENFFKYVNNLKKQHIEKNDKGDLYILVTSYSRVVRALLGEIFSNSAYDNVYVVVCPESIHGGTFSSRLMYHQILEECYSGEKHFKENPIYRRVWRSSFDQFESRLLDGDSVIYIGGCDHLDLLDCNGESKLVALKYSSISMLECLARDKKSVDVYVYILGSEYKLRPETLVKYLDRNESNMLYKDINDILPKQRRSYLYRWGDRKPKYIKEIKIVSSNLLQNHF